MRPTLYGVLEDTRAAAAELRAAEVALSSDVNAKLARFESAVAHALSSSPDGQHVSHPEETVALDALCELHLALQNAADSLRERFRPIVDAWISYAVATGMTPQELAARAVTAGNELDGWLDEDGRSTI